MQRVRWLCLLLFLAGCQPNLPATRTNTSPQWVSLNANLPTHATVVALAVDPTNPKVIFAGTYDRVGIYQSTDGGTVWRAENKGLAPIPVFALLATRAELFAGTADGLYRRAWNADYWQRADPVPQWAVYGLALDTQGAVYAATDGRGIWKSADAAAAAWTRLPGLDDEPLLSVLPLENQSFLAGTAGRGLWITRDGGKAWSRVNELENGYVSLVTRDPNRPKTVFARARQGLFRSADSGATWSKLTGGIETEIVNALAFDGQRILAAAAGGGIFLSEADGATWRAAAVENPRKRAILAFLRVDKTLYAGTFDGLLKSDDNGESWRVVGTGLGAPIIYDMAADAGRMLAATEDGLYELRGSDYARLDFGPDDVPALAVSIAPSAPKRIYLGTDGKGVFVSDDGGKMWDGATGELGGKTRVPQLVVDPTNPENVFARVLFERIYKSTSGGDDWRTVWTGMPVEEQIQSVAIAPNAPRILYAGGDTQMFSSNDGGEAWTTRGLNGVSALALWIDPGAPNRVWAGATDGLYRSEDSGQSWRGPQPEGISIAAITRAPNGMIYLGSKYQGAFVSNDGGATFAVAGLAGESVNQLVVDSVRNMLLARTASGILALDLNSK